MSETNGRPTDSDLHKGAVDSDKPAGPTSSNPARPDQHGNLSSQLPHRKINTGGADTDFPEPGSNPEHSGEKTSKS